MNMLRRALWAILLVGALATSLFADGKVFSTGDVRVNIPDQSALLCFDGKTERLVIETAFDGKGEDFAWVVPLPSVPRIEAATPGLFPTLRVITRPRVIPHDSGWYVVALLLLICAIAFWVWFSNRSLLDCLVVTFVILLFPGILLPSLSKARESSGANVFNVVVHSRGRVGAYDTAVVSGKDGSEILAWLNDSGFFVPPESAAVMRDYASRGWVFAAAKLRRPEEASVTGATHPLSFTFQTDRAVYPMRLTGVGNSSLSLQLFVVGDQEAQVGGLKRQRTAGVDAGQFGNHEGRRYVTAAEKDDFVPVVHESLRGYMKDGQALTLLTGELSPKEMGDDLWIEWKQPRPYRKIYYMPEGAVARGALWGSAAFLIGTIMSVLFLGWRESAREKRSHNRRVMLRPVFVFLGVVALAVLVGETVYLLVPTVPRANLVRGGIFANSKRHYYEKTAEFIELSDEGTPDERFRELRAKVREAFEDLVNPFSGKPFKEEDSPFNYTLELVDDVPTYFYYDESGAKIKLKSFPAGASGEGQKPGGHDV